VIFQIALMILENKKDKLLEAHDDGEAMTILAAYLENITSKDSTIEVQQKKTLPTYKLR